MMRDDLYMGKKNYSLLIIDSNGKQSASDFVGKDYAIGCAKEFERLAKSGEIDAISIKVIDKINKQVLHLYIKEVKVNIQH